MKKLLVIVFILSITFSVSAQDSIIEPRVIQLSGILVCGDSLEAVAYANIFSKRAKKRSISDYSGFFSTVAKEGDSIVFSSIGYKTSIFQLPDTLNSSHYSLVHVMEKDTVYLKEVTVQPWPTYEQFKNIFDDIEVPETDMDRAQKNLEDIAAIDVSQIQTPDASLSYKYQMEEYKSKLYYIGQLPPNNLLNPLAWAEFVKAWKNGDFKND